MLFLMGKSMEKRDKEEQINAQLSKEIKACEEFLSFEFSDWRIKSLADRIKLQKYGPNIKIYNL